MSLEEQYEIPWRPAWELASFGGWAAAGASCALLGGWFQLPEVVTLSGAAGCLAMMGVRGTQGYRTVIRRNRVLDGGLEFIRRQDLQKITNKKSEQYYWGGKGFLMGQEQAQKLAMVNDQGPERVFGKDIEKLEYAYWLHGLEKESDLFYPLADEVGHKLILGTTRTGKTRLIDLIITQAVLRGEPVIVIDPKGDHELRENMKAAYEAIGKPELFNMFHPAYPDQSVRLDPLSNWNRSTEIASRIAALIPSETGADPFTAFGWQALNNIVNGLLMIHERPNLLKLRRYVEIGPEDLVTKALEAHFVRFIERWEEKSAPYLKNARGDTAQAYIEFYRHQVAAAHPSPELEGLISSYLHNREHFQKMIASLIPILGMLTSGPLRELLSPQASLDDLRPIIDLARVIRTGGGLYVGLDTLSDTTVGSALGSILCADMTAVAGDAYNYGVSDTPVNLIIDEAAEVINDPLIQILNKGGGAKIRTTIALQTVADLASRLGNKDKAMKVLGNLNTIFSLRVQDPQTAKFVTDKLPMVELSTLERAYRHGAKETEPLNFSGSYSEQLKKKKEPLIPTSVLLKLPPLHYFSILPSGKIFKGRLPILIR